MNENMVINHIMDKKKIKYFYFDLDGTLLNDQKVLSKENVLALKKLMQLGYKVGIISGRPNYMIKKEINWIKPNLPLVSINGGKIIDINNKILSSTLINLKTFQQITKFLINNDITFLAYGENVMYYYLKINKKSNWIDRYKKTIKELSPKFKWEFKPFDSNVTRFSKIFILTNKVPINLINKFEKFIEKFNDIYIVNSAVGSLDLMPYGISKGWGLQFLAQKQIIDLTKTIVFGDADNDISMFKVAIFSIAMQNANEKLKKMATMINKFSNNENGVANFIKEVILNEKNYNK